MIPLPSLLAAVRDHPFEVPTPGTLSVVLGRPVWEIKQAIRQATDRRQLNFKADGSVSLTSLGLATVGSRRAPSRR